MNKVSRRLLSVLLAILIFAGVIVSADIAVFAEDDPYHATGYCGADADSKNIEYYLFDDGSIAFFGSGAMKDYSNPGAANPAGPWYISNPMEALLGSKIAVEDGITSVGDYAFYLPSYYTFMLQTYSIDLPNSLLTIGTSAFENQNKVEKISIPKNVTTVGDRAFAGCTKLAHVDVYGNPSLINWGTNVFTQNVTVHIKPDYASQLSTLNSTYNSKNMVFEANLHTDNLIDDGIERNIKAYMGQESSKIFAGAAPIVIVGTFSGSKKSVTRGSNGFVSCVRIGDDSNPEYYIHTNNNSQNLNLAAIATGGRVESLSADAHQSLKLKVDFEYIGTNIVKVIYSLRNQGSAPVNEVMLGGTGDIKIGADDTAAIEPLYALDEQQNTTNKQIGFYMKSGKEYDYDGSNYATLGFIGKDVDLGENTKSPDATYFYGKADSNVTNSAVGAYQLRLMPERIFTENNNPASQESGPFPAAGESVDSGMSYYWNVGTIDPNETKQYAVLFSVYGTNDAESGGKGEEMVEDLSAKFYTVTWKDADGNILLKQSVKHGDAPKYTGDTPTKHPEGNKAYVFDKWLDENNEPITSETKVYSDVTYTAQFDETQRTDYLFKGHSLSLMGDIGVLFFLERSEVDEGARGNKAVVHFNWTVKGEEKSSDYYITIGETSDQKTVTVDGKAETYYVAKCNVPAAEMSYNLHATAYIDGVKHWDEDDYSVREYGMKIINNPGSYESNLVTLAKEMLNYGAKAQIIFDRRDVELANYQVQGYSMDNTVTEDSFFSAVKSEQYNINRGVTASSNMRADNSSFGLAYQGSSVVFLTKTSLRHYYTVSSENSHATTYSITDASTGAVKNKTLTPKDELLYTEVEDIPAAELDVLQKLTIGGQDYYFSVIDYARLMFTKGNANERNFGLATYLYNRAANVYFANHSYNS